jgi:hypothetical protein
MRRAVLLSAALGLFAAGLGCKHVAGMCDCTHDPANAQINPGGPGVAYPTLGPPVGGVPTPEKMPAPAEKMTAPMGK